MLKRGFSGWKFDLQEVLYRILLEGKKDLRAATFQRGSAYYRKNDFAKAKIDLDEFSKNGGSAEFMKNQATKMLNDIAAKAQQH